MELGIGSWIFLTLLALSFVGTAITGCQKAWKKGAEDRRKLGL